MRRPYENENPMDVVGHRRELVQEKPREMGWQVSPALIYHLAERGKDHPPVRDVPQHTLPVVCADRDEVRSWLGVAVSAQAEGTTMVGAGLNTDHVTFP